jgi:hypothetical protein
MSLEACFESINNTFYQWFVSQQTLWEQEKEQLIEKIADLERYADVSIIKSLSDETRILKMENDTLKRRLLGKTPLKEHGRNTKEAKEEYSIRTMLEHDSRNQDGVESVRSSRQTEAESVRSSRQTEAESVRSSRQTEAESVRSSRQNDEETVTAAEPSRPVIHKRTKVRKTATRNKAESLEREEDEAVQQATEEDGAAESVTQPSAEQVVEPEQVAEAEPVAVVEPEAEAEEAEEAEEPAESINTFLSKCKAVKIKGVQYYTFENIIYDERRKSVGRIENKRAIFNKN